MKNSCHLNIRVTMFTWWQVHGNWDDRKEEVCVVYPTLMVGQILVYWGTSWPSALFKHFPPCMTWLWACVVDHTVPCRLVMMAPSLWQFCSLTPRSRGPETPVCCSPLFLKCFTNRELTYSSMLVFNVFFLFFLLSSNYFRKHTYLCLPPHFVTQKETSLRIMLMVSLYHCLKTE